jgi:hypothetical protein
MKNHQLYLLSGLLLSVLFLQSCELTADNEFPDTDASIRVVNYHTALDSIAITTFDGEAFATAIYNEVTDYQNIKAGGNRFDIPQIPEASGTFDKTRLFLMEYDRNYLMVTMGNANRTIIRVLDNNPIPSSIGNNRVRFLNAIPGTAAYNIYIIPNTTGASNATQEEISAASPIASDTGYNNGADSFIPYSNVPGINGNVFVAVTTTAGALLYSTTANLAPSTNHTGIIHREKGEPTSVRITLYQDN